MERAEVINFKNIVNEKHCLQMPIKSSPRLLWEYQTTYNNFEHQNEKNSLQHLILIETKKKCPNGIL